MHIRFLDPGTDISPIMAFLPELYETNFPGFKADAAFLARKRTHLREAVRDPGQSVLVAVDEQGIAGFVWLVVEVDHRKRRRGEVAAVHVAARSRGQGVGRQLLAEGESVLRSYGCTSIQLMVTASNEVALDFYTSKGYKVTRYQMEKPLP